MKEHLNNEEKQSFKVNSIVIVKEIKLNTIMTVRGSSSMWRQSMQIYAACGCGSMRFSGATNSV